MRAKLPHVQRFADRHGKMRYYFRKGKARAPLPDPTKGWDAFLKAYQQAAHGIPTRRAESGTMAALISEFIGSQDYKALKPNSRATYMHALEFLRHRESAAAPIDAITRLHIIRMRDEIAETLPGKANLILKVVKRLFAFAHDRGHIAMNPALKIRAIKGGEYRSWTDDELLRFEKHWPRGTTERLIYELALYTGQRRGDLAKMTWGDIRDGVVSVVQEKTGSKVWIPLAPSLALELGQRPRRHAVVLAGASGRSLTPRYLGTLFADAIQAAGLPTECVLHGLRKAATRRLAEAGATDTEIMSVTGHMSRGMVTLYTRDADKKKMAQSAMRKLAEDEE